MHVWGSSTCKWRGAFSVWLQQGRGAQNQRSATSAVGPQGSENHRLKLLAAKVLVGFWKSWACPHFANPGPPRGFPTKPFVNLGLIIDGICRNAYARKSAQDILYDEKLTRESFWHSTCTFGEGDPCGLDMVWWLMVLALVDSSLARCIRVACNGNWSKRCGISCSAWLHIIIIRVAQRKH